MLWTFDTLRRLNDANARDKDLRADQSYIEPGTLWWAFDPNTAVQRGKGTLPDPDRAQEPWEGKQHDAAVVLLDEIDKADPDVPNDLLEAFDLRAFTVRETGHRIEASVTRDVLLILTTNGERELPPAFMRRCVTLELAIAPKEEIDWFVRIAQQRDSTVDESLAREIAAEIARLRDGARKGSLRMPGTAEYLDALEACRQLKIRTGTDAWSLIEQNVLWKRGAPIPAKVVAAT